MPEEDGSYVTQLGRMMQFVVLYSPFGPVDIGLYDSNGKRVAKIGSKYVTSMAYGEGPGEERLIDPAEVSLVSSKLKAGTYTLKTNYSSRKDRVSEQTIVIEDWVAPTLAEETTDVLAAGLMHGQVVPIRWTAGEHTNYPMSITASNGTKTVKVSSKELTVDGAGFAYWVVPKKLDAGEWTLTVANAVKGAESSVESDPFTVSADPTILDRKIKD
ncbi:MAG: hypothetical protein R2715_01320 [Ilumatobacteraceae bacterium]